MLPVQRHLQAEGTVPAQDMTMLEKHTVVKSLFCDIGPILLVSSVFVKRVDVVYNLCVSPNR